jgi:hypothetical protein
VEYNSNMAKDPANMTHAERMSALMRDLHSSSSVAKADKMLELVGHEWLDLLGVREMAARRHGDTSPAPSMPTIASLPAADEYAQKATTTSNSEPSNHGWTVAILIERYRAHPDSPYLKLRFKTRVYYDTLIKRILADCGNDEIVRLKTKEIEWLHKSWTKRGVAMAKALITMFRSVVYFGATTLADAECERLSVALHRMRFEVAKSVNVPLTAEQVNGIRNEARKMDRSSIALAQAFQFDFQLPQKDTVGEWVPVSEPEDSDVFDAGNKWLRGIRWERLDENLVLSHTTSRSQKEIKLDLKLAPMVLQELRLTFGSIARDKLPASGPIIISEMSGIPWYTVEFRRNWRIAADAAGVPRNVKNMGSRGSTKSEHGERDNGENVDLNLDMGTASSLTH